MILLKNGIVFDGKDFNRQDVLIDKEEIIEVRENISGDYEVIDCEGKIIAPSFIDPHVHLREPGISYKETIKTGTKAAAHGGFTHVFAMPNVNPVPSNKKAISQQQTIIDRDSCIDVSIIGSITVNQTGEGQITDISETHNLVIGYSDDGRGIKDSYTMYQAMVNAKKYNKPIISHCEDISLVNGGCITECDFAKEHNLKEIMPESETVELARNLILANKTGCHLHVCHISCKESVDLVRYYKAKGCHVTAEVCPHHLILSDKDLKLDGNYKMNPPLMTQEHIEALIAGLKDGTIDCLATDHAPHAVDEKNCGLEKSAFGIVGLETAFPLMYTHFVKKNIISLKTLLNLMSDNVAQVFNLKEHKIAKGYQANLCVIDLDAKSIISSKDFLSLGSNSPFIGKKVDGKIIYTMYKGAFVYGK